MLARPLTKSPPVGEHVRPAAARLPSSCPGAIGNQAALRRLQAKLTVGAANDPLEHEADAVADKVMRMADPALAVSASPPRISRKCAACEEEAATGLQRRDSGAAWQGDAAPPVVHDTLRSPGRPLDPAARRFFEPRFGRDLGAVRVHDDPPAAVSALSVGAAAYTVGSQIVFGAGRYQPASDEGRRLIAHELTHTIQQGADTSLRRAPCRSAADCAAPTPSDPGAFSRGADRAELSRQARLAAAAPGSPEAALRARLGQRATHFEHLLALNGIALKPDVVGFFINPNIDPALVAAQTNRCRLFPGGSPGAPPAPADKFCVQLPAETEDRAQTLDTGAPLTDAQKAQLAEILSTGVHEMQHATFNQVEQNPATRTIGPEADCNLDTVVGASDVKFLLSEISAVTSEFPVFFKNIANQSNPSAALFAEEREQATGQGESLQGAIRTLKCGCSCATTDTFTTKAVNETIAGWPAPQTLAFFQAMTRIIPADWPKALQRT